MNAILMAVLTAGVIVGLDHNIVSPAWLEQNLDNPYVVVMEIGTTADRPHIPGARFVSIDSIVKRDGWPPDELPPAGELRRVFENAGVGDRSRIILYGDSPVFATRAWFTLESLGLGDRVAILDGGFARWTAEKRPVAAKRIAPLPATLTLHPDPNRIASLAEIRDAGPDTIVIDARSPYEFHGLRRGVNVTRRGHVPGAECSPWSTNYARGGSFLPEAELRARYEKLVPDRNARVIVYCRTGMDASVPYFVLRSLGYDVALYDGSYAEWSRDRSLPVARLSFRK
ncbi:MAG TPA: rhodanese-like domain-containing protein [Thermoanaerobaculia bacterium]